MDRGFPWFPGVSRFARKRPRHNTHVTTPCKGKMDVYLASNCEITIKPLRQHVLLHVRSENSGTEEIHILFEQGSDVNLLSPVGRSLLSVTPSCACRLRLSLPSYGNDGKQLDLGPNHCASPETSIVKPELEPTSLCNLSDCTAEAPKSCTSTVHPQSPRTPPKNEDNVANSQLDNAHPYHARPSPPTALRHKCTICQHSRAVEAFSVFQTDLGRGTWRCRSCCRKQLREGNPNPSKPDWVPANLCNTPSICDTETQSVSISEVSVQESYSPSNENTTLINTPCKLELEVPPTDPCEARKPNLLGNSDCEPSTKLDCACPSTQPQYDTQPSFMEFVEVAYQSLLEVLSPYDQELLKKHQGIFQFDVYVVQLVRHLEHIKDLPFCVEFFRKLAAQHKFREPILGMYADKVMWSLVPPLPPSLCFGFEQSPTVTTTPCVNLTQAPKNPTTAVRKAQTVYVNDPPTGVEVQGQTQQIVNAVKSRSLTVETNCRCGVVASCIYFRRESADIYTAVPFCNLCRLSRPDTVLFLGKPIVLTTVPLTHVPPLENRVPIWHCFECQAHCGSGLLPNYIKRIGNREFLLCSACNRMRISALKEELSFMGILPKQDIRETKNSSNGTRGTAKHSSAT